MVASSLSCLCSSSAEVNDPVISSWPKLDPHLLHAHNRHHSLHSWDVFDCKIPLNTLKCKHIYLNYTKTHLKDIFSQNQSSQCHAIFFFFFKYRFCVVFCCDDHLIMGAKIVSAVVLKSHMRLLYPNKV